MHLVHKGADAQVASISQGGGTRGPLLHMHSSSKILRLICRERARKP